MPVALQQLTYTPFGPVTGWVYGNGLATRRPVDLDYQLQAVELLHTDTQGVQTTVGLRLGYIFDAVGNLLRLEDSRNPATVKRRFGYDGLDRLASMRTADEVALQSYTYDATGNRTAMTEQIPVFNGTPGGGGTTTYQTINHTYTYPASSHRLTAVDGVPRSYDAAGNLVQLGDATMPGGPREFGYDASNRMAQMSRLSQVKASYAYNGAGERVRKTTPGGVETYSLHDPAGRWVGDYDGSGQPIQQAVWFGDLPVGVIATVPATAGQTQQKLFHLQPDMLGTPRVAVDPSRGAIGTVVWTWDLEGEAFGSEPAQADPDGDGVAFQLDMRFPGQRIDGTTGLHYNYFRDYEPGSGRYVQSDPIGLGGGISTYAYAGSMPTGAIDPMGLACNAKGCWVTAIERQFARNGDWDFYYQSACLGGDTYACRAGEVASQTGLTYARYAGALFTNVRLANSLIDNDPALQYCPEELESRMDAIRQALVRGHVAALDQAGASPGNPVRLPAQAIAEFHYAAFEQNGASRSIFGGDFLGGYSAGRRIVNWVCHGAQPLHVDSK